MRSRVLFLPSAPEPGEVQLGGWSAHVHGASARRFFKQLSTAEHCSFRAR